MQATAIVARNSLHYVDSVFGYAQTRRVVVSVPDAKQAAALPGIEVDGCIETAMQHGWYTKRHDLILEDLPAQITFTSGTEGKPKGIVLSYANLADTAGRIIRAMGMTGEIREYVGVPVTYSFGMGRFRAIGAVGGSAYLSPRGFDPMEFARMLAADEVNALSVVPTLLRVLLDSPEVIGAAGRKLRWMEIGSQYLSASEKRRVREMFPEARIVQHYGLTEASRSTFLDVSHAAEQALESVGRPEGDVQIGFDVQGRIRIRGPHVARWRVDADGLHALCDAEGWLQTNDLGHLRDGMLFFDGRADDLINCGGVKIVPDILEEKIRARLGAGARIAVARVRDEARGEAVLAVIEGDQKELPRLKEAASAALTEMGAGAAGNLHVRSVKTIPVTSTGKPLRRELTAGFEPERAAATPQQGATTVLALFQRVFPGNSIEPEDTFESLGGDSLRYIQFSMQFERQFGFSPARWETLTVAQLQQRVESSRQSFWRSLEPGTLFRAVAIIFIVARHTGAFSYSRNFGAGILLFALGGYALARFQLPEIMRKGSVRSALGTALLVAIPTILITIPTEIMTHTFEPLQFVLMSNFVNPADPHRINGIPFYFAEVYFQLFLLAALLFSFARVRTLFREHPLASAIGLFAVALGLKFMIDAVWDTHYLYQRVPQNYAWLFCLGVVVGVAKTLPQRLLAFVLVAVTSYVLWGFESSAYLLSGALGLVLFVPAFQVPAPVKSVVGEIAAASIFIYLIHFQMISVVVKVFGEKRPWIALLGTLAVGIVAAYVYGYMQRLFGQTRVGRRVFGSLTSGERAGAQA